MVTGAIHEAITDLLERVTPTNDAFRPSSTASVRVRYSRVSPWCKLHLNVKQPSRNSFPPTAGQCRSECIRWRWIHHERYQDREATGRIHEQVGHEQRSSHGWHELSLMTEGGQRLSCRGICWERRLLHNWKWLTCPHEISHYLLDCSKLTFQTAEAVSSSACCGVHRRYHGFYEGERGITWQSLHGRCTFVFSVILANR